MTIAIKEKPIAPTGGTCGTSDCPQYAGDSTGYCTLTGIYIPVDCANEEKLISSYPCKPWADRKLRDYDREVLEERVKHRQQKTLKHSIRDCGKNILKTEDELQTLRSELRDLENKLKIMED